jgi:ABC-type transport system substrate-binding protein
MSMKIAFIITLILLAVLACGCTTTSTTAPAAPALAEATPAIPDLVGTWTGPSAGYDEGTGFTDYNDLGITMVVTEQKDRIFAGQIIFTMNGTESATGFAGVIGRDGKTFSMSEQAGGYCFGEITGPDAIEITYLEDGSPYSASVDFFTRAK